jgi:phosphatidylserine decarboxylase
MKVLVGQSAYDESVRVAPEGWIILIPMTLVCLSLATASVWFIQWQFLGVIIALMVLGFLAWGYWFFRDPVRTVPNTAAKGAIISPADGKVIKIDRVLLPRELRAEAEQRQTGAGARQYERIAIFLNLFNVHVNRAICEGTIEHIAYTPGAFVNASFDKASEANERSVVLMKDDRGQLLAFSQIAGLVARRIVNHLRVGQRVASGERFGLIRFGSRAEVYMPLGTDVRVKVGQHVVAGITTLAVRAEAQSGAVTAEKRAS